MSYVPRKDKNIMFVSTMHEDDGKRKPVVDQACGNYNCTGNADYFFIAFSVIHSMAIFHGNNLSDQTLHRHFIYSIDKQPFI